MNKKKNISHFFENTGSIAVIGVSKAANKGSHMLYKALKQSGYNVFAVNNQADTIDGESCYKSIEVLPDSITAAIILTPQKVTPEVFQQVVNKGIKNIWIQQGAHNPEVLNLVTNDVNLVYNKCIYMFAEPVKGVHKFHRSLLRFFGMLPK